jgi:hypothetical protein
MDSRPAASKLATTSLTLAIVGWVLYLGQWCFDLTLGLLFAAATAGTSAVCSTVLDILPFVLWIVGVVTGHAALRQIKATSASGRGKAVWGLVLNYTGLFFLIIITVAIIALVAAGVGAGIFDKVFPFIRH